MSKPKILRVAAAQFHNSLDQNRNFEKIRGMIHEAARLKCRILVLQECGLTGYAIEENTDYRYVDDSLQQSQLKEIRRLAKKHRLAIAVGAAIEKKSQRYNRAILIGHDGRTRGVYDKIHLTERDVELFAPGRALPVFGLGGVKVGMQICLDHRIPEAWRTLKQRGAQVILHLSATIATGEWKVPVLEGVLRARSSENGYYIVSANASGPVQGLKSAIYDPKGLLLAQANYGVEQLIHAEIDLGKIRPGFPPLPNQRIYETRSKKTAPKYNVNQ